MSPLDQLKKLSSFSTNSQVEMSVESLDAASLTINVRGLIGRYGVRAVHEEIMKEMRDTYAYLHDVFGVKNEIVMPVQQRIIPTVEVATFIPENNQEFCVETDSLVEEEQQPQPSDPTVKQVIITSTKTIKTPVTQTTPLPIDVKQVKQMHRDEVEKKKQELITKGIKPESLLTEANLKKWIGEGQSYLKIAKGTGVHENQVATLAKSFGLQSKISKYVAMKKTTQV